MTIKLSDVSLGTYKQLVAASLSIIKKAENYFTEQNIDLNELSKMRLIEDMAPLTFQVFSIVHHSVGAIEALKSGEFGPPNTPDNLCFQDLVSMLKDANSTLNEMNEEDINLLADGEVIFKMGQIEWPFTSEDFILSFSLPNFYFHVTTMYDMFRIKGLNIGKLDFAGSLKIRTNK
tara:strand:- start:57 stop:584 length:528 start_codon:yes stop_codon:yes gene_type:complete